MKLTQSEPLEQLEWFVTLSSLALPRRWLSPVPMWNALLKQIFQREHNEILNLSCRRQAIGYLQGWLRNWTKATEKKNPAFVVPEVFEPWTAGDFKHGAVTTPSCIVPTQWVCTNTQRRNNLLITDRTNLRFAHHGVGLAITAFDSNLLWFLKRL